jgi:hypothetical protein
MMTLSKTASQGLGALFASLVLIWGCTRSGVKIQELPDGAHGFECHTPLPQCLGYVDSVCKGNSYEVLYARDEETIYGVGQNYVEGHKSRAQVHCLGPHEPPRYDDETPAAASAAPSASAPLTAGAPGAGAALTANNVANPSPSGAPAAHACVPGTTQSCVGPAACAGGQACLADGSGYGACDCGAATPAAPGAPSR